MGEDKNHYKPTDDYCARAEKSQSVLSNQEASDYLKSNGKSSESDDVSDFRKQTKYSCDDDYHMGTIQDNQIYIATTNNQHAQLLITKK